MYQITALRSVDWCYVSCHLVADISKVMQAKRKRLECLTKNYMKGSQNKLEELWNTYHGQRFGFTVLRIKVTDRIYLVKSVLSWGYIQAQRSLFLLKFCVFRQKITQQYSQQVSTALQQWETEAQRSEEQEEKFNVSSLFFSSPAKELLIWYSVLVLWRNCDSIVGYQRKEALTQYTIYWVLCWCICDVSHLQSMFRQQLKILQQARVVQNQKLKMVRELYEQFVKVTTSELHVYIYPIKALF